MLRIAYISSLKPGFSSRELLNIQSEAKHRNQSLGITSVLITVKGAVFQLIEGPKGNVAALMYAIRRDIRHKNVSLVLKQNSKNRLFKTPIRILGQHTVGRHVIQQTIYVESGNALQIQNQSDAARFKLLFETIIDSTPAAPTLDSKPLLARYENTLLSLTAWPKHRDIEFTPKIMRLCSLLKKAPQPYELLIDQYIFKDTSTLVAQLDRLKKSNLLIIQPKPKTPDYKKQAASKTTRPEPTNSRFSTKLKSFLATVRNA